MCCTWSNEGIPRLCFEDVQHQVRSYEARKHDATLDQAPASHDTTLPSLHLAIENQSGAGGAQDGGARDAFHAGHCLELRIIEDVHSSGYV